MHRVAPVTWTKIFPSHFRHRDLEKLDEHFRRTGNEPLYIRALLPWPANSTSEHTFKDVALMVNKHAHRLRALQIRAVTPDPVVPFLQHALFSTNRPVTFLEELDVSVKCDSSDEHGEQVALVLQDAAETLPSLKSLVLPGYIGCIPTPNPSSIFSNLIHLGVNGAGLSNATPLYELFRFLHHTPNLQSLFYKTADQFSYQIGRTPPSGSWAPTKKYKPVSLPVLLPHLHTGDVSASGSGADLLRNITAPNLERVHMDGSRIQDGLEDWHIGLIGDVGDVLGELSQRSPSIRSISLTEMPLEESVFKRVLGGEDRNGDAAQTANGLFPFRKLEELIVQDMELSEHQTALLFEGGVEDGGHSEGKPSVGTKVELTNSALADYASKPNGVVLRKLGIHRAKRLAPDIIVAAGRKGVETLARNGVTGPFVMEFMQNQGPPADCVNKLHEIGVKVEWTEEVEGSDTDRSGWWTADFKLDDCFHG